MTTLFQTLTTIAKLAVEDCDDVEFANHHFNEFQRLLVLVDFTCLDEFWKENRVKVPLMQIDSKVDEWVANLEDVVVCINNNGASRLGMYRKINLLLMVISLTILLTGTDMEYYRIMRRIVRFPIEK